ncbi:hypothetical protein B0T13DRAFT_515512 [Neurospora crassa]|nr:hypothetical protein B0T13DRAFT_515512 [Neurospora crassa]
MTSTSPESWTITALGPRKPARKDIANLANLQALATVDAQIQLYISLGRRYKEDSQQAIHRRKSLRIVGSGCKSQDTHYASQNSSQAKRRKTKSVSFKRKKSAVIADSEEEDEDDDEENVKEDDIMPAQEADIMFLSIPHQRLLVIALRRGILKHYGSIDELLDGDRRNIIIKEGYLNDSVCLQAKAI